MEESTSVFKILGGGLQFYTSFRMPKYKAEIDFLIYA